MVHVVSRVGAAGPVCGFPRRGSERRMSCVHTGLKKAVPREGKLSPACRLSSPSVYPAPLGRACLQPLLRETHLGHPSPTGVPAQSLVATAPDLRAASQSAGLVAYEVTWPRSVAQRGTMVSQPLGFAMKFQNA